MAVQCLICRCFVQDLTSHLRQKCMKYSTEEERDAVHLDARNRAFLFSTFQLMTYDQVVEGLHDCGHRDPDVGLVNNIVTFLESTLGVHIKGVPKTTVPPPPGFARLRAPDAVPADQVLAPVAPADAPVAEPEPYVATPADEAGDVEMSDEEEHEKDAVVCQDEVVEGSRTTKRRGKKACPLCDKMVVHVPRHLMGKVHSMSKDGVDSLMNAEKSASKAKYARPLVTCPVHRCQTRIQRVDHHLIEVHGYQRASKEYIEMVATTKSIDAIDERLLLHDDDGHDHSDGNHDDDDAGDDIAEANYDQLNDHPLLGE